MTEISEPAKQIVLVEGKLTKIIHQEGEGETPKKGQQIFALYRGTLQNGTQFDSNQDRQSPFSFVLGQGRVIKGWDEGFASMKKGEKATLICSPEYAYGARGSPPKIPANATLNFEVQLLDFKDKQKESWEYTDEQKLVEATNHKNSGNDSLKQGDYKSAVQAYKKGIDLIQNDTAPENKQLLNILRLNSAQANLKLGNYSEVINDCTKVLKQQGSVNAKALYRRGLAYLKTQQFELSQNDFKQLLKSDPENSQAKKQLSNVARAIQQFKQKQKKVFGNIFSKGGLYEDKKVQAPKITPDIKKIESDEDIDEQNDQKEKMDVEQSKGQGEQIKQE